MNDLCYAASKKLFPTTSAVTTQDQSEQNLAKITKGQSPWQDWICTSRTIMKSSSSKPVPGAFFSAETGDLPQRADADQEPKFTAKEGLSFRFLTFTRLHEHRDKDVRRFVRSHAQRDYQTKRRMLSEEKVSTKKLILPAASRQALCLASVPSPATYLASGQDPFSSLPMDLSEVDRFCLHRYFQFAFDADSGNHLGRVKTIQVIYLPIAVKDPVLLNGLLRSGAKCLALSNPEERRFERQALHYKGKMIAAMNQVLTNEPRAISSDLGVARLLALTALEYLDGNRKEYYLHAKALHHLVELRGGLDQLGMKGFLGESIIGVDLGATAIFALEPLFIREPPRKSVMCIDSLTSGFLPQAILSNLSEQLISILNDMCTLLNAANTTDSNIDLHHLRDCHERMMLFTGQQQKFNRLHGVPEIQESVCYAAQIFYLYVAAEYPTAGAFAAEQSSRKIFQAVSRLLELNTYRFLDLLLWAAFMGSLAVEASEDIRKWSKIITSIVGHIGIGTWEEVMSILKTFLWLEPRSGRLGKATWLCARALSDEID